MGGAISYAASPSSMIQAAICGNKPDAKGGGGADYLHLPCPVKYEEITREAFMSLKPELFEGLRFDLTKPLNQKFSLSHSLFMGSVDMPHPSGQILKTSAAHYEFGANLIDQKGNMEMVMMIGRILTDGRMSARVKYDVNDRFSIKANAQLTNEPHFSVGMFNFDYRGNDYQAQMMMGNNAFYGVNYIQAMRSMLESKYCGPGNTSVKAEEKGKKSYLYKIQGFDYFTSKSVTSTLALGGEGMWLGHQRKSGIGFAARYNTPTVIATGLVKSGGNICLTYVQKVSEKVTLASDFAYNWNTKEAMTSVGYDYLLRQCRLRGRVDTNGCIAAYLEEKLNLGVNFLLSAEIDHRKKDYKFGFGMTVGE